MDDKRIFSEWDLQQYLIGELPSQELDAIRSRELCDDGLRARLGALRACHAEIKAQYPTAWMARKLQLRAESRTAGVRPQRSVNAEKHGAYNKLWMRIAVPAFACIAMVVGIPIYMSSTYTPDGELSYGNTRIKGDGNLSERVKGVSIGTPELQIWRRTADGPERLAPGVTARQGDMLQLWYVVPAPCYGTLVSVDGRGVLTVHLSGSDGRAMFLTHGRPVSLPSAYRLDDAPDYEAFYLITSPDEFDLESVKKTILGMGRKAANVPEISLPEKQVIAFTLRKNNGKGT